MIQTRACNGEPTSVLDCGVDLLSTSTPDRILGECGYASGERGYAESYFVEIAWAKGRKTCSTTN